MSPRLGVCRIYKNGSVIPQAAGEEASQVEEAYSVMPSTRTKMGKFKIAIVERGQENVWRKYWISSGSTGTAEEAPDGLSRTEVVEAATVDEAIAAVQRRHPNFTVMLAGGDGLRRNP